MTCVRLAGWLLLGSCITTAQIRLHVDPNRVTGRIPETVYGHFLEHIYHSVNGGLWGDMIWNRSFEQKPTPIEGRWHTEGEELIQDDLAPARVLLLGDYRWENYQISVEIQKTAGDGQAGIRFRVCGLDPNGQLDSRVNTFYRVALGGSSSLSKSTERGMGRREVSVEPLAGIPPIPMTERQWHRLRIRANGHYIRVWLDGREVGDYVDWSDRPIRSGKIALETSGTAVRFRNLKVADLAGRVLYEGMPELPAPGVGDVAAFWRPVGNGAYELSADRPLNSRWSQAIRSDGSPAGIAQSPLRIRKGERYLGSYWARGDAAEGIELRIAEGSRTAFARRSAALSADWQEFPFNFVASTDCERATLSLWLTGKGHVWLDQVSLMPGSAVSVGGFRPDLLNAAAALKPPLIRWPGGGYASTYLWKKGIGPQSKRISESKEMWDDVDPNSFGTDEFVAFCRRVGAEPLMVLNLGTRGDESDIPARLQDALDWIEYCNGPASSEYGRLRALKGHPEPYNIRYWELDNEWYWGVRQSRYLAALEAFASKIRTRFPDLHLIATGGNGYGMQTGHEQIMLERFGRLFDSISLHRYERPWLYAEGPEIWERYIEKVKATIGQSGFPKVNIYASEWNGHSIDWRVGLLTGGLLNLFERQGDVVWAAAPALFLRHVSGTGYDNGLINFDYRGWFAGANYVVMKLWREHYAPERVAIDGDAGDLNVMATRAADRKTVYLKFVNSIREDKSVLIDFGSGFRPASATEKLVAPGDLLARNSLDSPDRIRVETVALDCTGKRIRATLPRWSVAAVAVRTSLQ